LKPVAVVGFGGYPTVPPLLASTGMGVPSLLHEQNAVMGRANKALAKRVKAIAGGFLPENQGEFGDKIVMTGNPVRPTVLSAAEIAYTPSQAGEDFNLVVFGGSQGAQFFSAAVPAAICLLPNDLRNRIKLTQQARVEDKDSVVESYKKLGVKADISPFFGDMAERIAQADLVISRSGASTVSELSVIGRPSVLVPYPHALDHDQAANAAALSAAGGASVIKQPELSPKALSALLADAMNDPARLEKTAVAAKATGKPDAAKRLADLVEAIAAGTSVQQFKSKNEGVHP
jgi:UDP-N-acetylglucosamine--N-acetylmuramyl-(pentapeptide) pyrophosphoryl-undecaprenol N-acetylglucosamine transferase